MKVVFHQPGLTKSHPTCLDRVADGDEDGNEGYQVCDSNSHGYPNGPLQVLANSRLYETSVEEEDRELSAIGTE
jgi:hypothetical protein